MKITLRLVYVGLGCFLVLLAFIFPQKIQQHQGVFTMVFVHLPICAWMVWMLYRDKAEGVYMGNLR
jgi:hypothetical protein